MRCLRLRFLRVGGARKIGAAALMVAAGVAVSSVAWAAGFVEVQIDANQNIRQLSERYLGDPDLWPEILKASNVASVAEVSAGRTLRIPVDTIAAADRAIGRSQNQISKANLAGAQIFAPDEIARAVGLYDEALDWRLKHEWESSKDKALSSFAEATNALSLSESRRDEAAEALVTDRQGAVEGQKPAALSWSDLQLRDTLIENEKIRTLSDSSAQLTFRDASRIRFNANSNAVIQQLRYDPLTKQENSKVSLVEGDFYALLSGKSERKNFSVDIPGAKAQIESGDFWVQSDDQGAKFTNYDSRTVDIATKKDTVVLGRNEGVVLTSAGDTKVKQAVLPPVNLASPANETFVYTASLDLTWAAADGAQAYWLEIGADQAFDRMITSKYGLAAAQFRAEALVPGTYFWRVAALDDFGLPGQRSEVWRFTVSSDTTPPFLQIDEPADNAITRHATIDIKGATEAAAAVTVNGQPARIAPGGQFDMPLIVIEGDSSIEIAAIDPAGNVTRLSRRIRYVPDQADAVIFDPAIPRDGQGRLISGSSVIGLAGKAKPSSRIDVVDAGGILRGSAMSDASGAFRLNADLTPDSESLLIAVTGPSGFRTESKFEVVVDRERPAIELAEEAPRITASAALFLRGRVSKPQARMTIDKQPVELEDGSFDQVVNLQPGDNRIELVAVDAVGNSDVVKFIVTLDMTPPELIAARFSAVADDAGSLVAVDIDATDESGLAAVARFSLGIGGETIEGVAKFNAATRRYQGAIPVPKGKTKAARLTTVELVDGAGNQKVFRLN